MAANSSFCFRRPANNCFVASKDMPWEKAAIIEPYTVAAQVSRGGVSEGDTVLILEPDRLH